MRDKPLKKKTRDPTGWDDYETVLLVLFNGKQWQIYSKKKGRWWHPIKKENAS
jgi:hypothetical protein